MKSGNGEAAKATETMNQMNIGDSFLVRDALEGIKATKCMRDKNTRGRQNGGGRLFASRQVKQGVRIWRIK